MFFNQLNDKIRCFLEKKRRKSFAERIKTKFSRKPKSKRSQSVDRASTIKDSALLTPPTLDRSRYSGKRVEGLRVYSCRQPFLPVLSTACSCASIEESEIDDVSTDRLSDVSVERQRSRSRSISSSLRRLFKGKKKDGADATSRDNSVSRQSTRSAAGARNVRFSEHDRVLS